MICSITQNKAEIFQEPKDVSNLETEALFGESFEIKKKKKQRLGLWKIIVRQLYWLDQIM